MSADRFVFIEYAAPNPVTMGRVFEGMGLKHVARHRHKNMLLYRQGGINFILNARPNSFVQRFARLFGLSASAPLHSTCTTPRCQDAYERAVLLGV